MKKQCEGPLCKGCCYKRLVPGAGDYCEGCAATIALTRPLPRPVAFISGIASRLREMESAPTPAKVRDLADDIQTYLLSKP